MITLKKKIITQQTIGAPILQSNYGLRLKNVILNGILCAILFYNAVKSYSPDNPVHHQRKGYRAWYAHCPRARAKAEKEDLIEVGGGEQGGSRAKVLDAAETLTAGCATRSNSIFAPSLHVSCMRKHKVGGLHVPQYLH